MNQNKASYNDPKTVEYYSSLNKFALFNYEKKIIDLFFNKNESVLDIGCGAGRTTTELFRLGFKVVGVDFSEAMVLEAKKNFPNIDFRVGNILNLNSFSENCFGNILFSFNGFSLLNFNNWKTALLQTWRVMKKDGIFFFTTPYLDNKTKQKYWKEKIEKNNFDLLLPNDRINLGYEILEEDGINFYMQIPFVTDLQNILSDLGYKIIFMGPRLSFFKEENCEELLDDNYLWVVKK